jgi:hypothetical protein
VTELQGRRPAISGNASERAIRVCPARDAICPHQERCSGSFCMVANDASGALAPEATRKGDSR